MVRNYPSLCISCPHFNLSFIRVTSTFSSEFGAKTQINLSEIFSPSDIVLCIAKVSLEVIADVTETETTLAKEEIIADKIVKTYTQN
jgi:hypothetical protein